MRGMDPNGKRVIVTGASSGIGRATALSFAAAGADVAAVARREERLQQLLAEAGPLRGSVVAVVADLSREEDARRMVTESVAALGGLDILINNAAVGMRNDAVATEMTTFRYLMDLNYFGVIAAIQEAVPHLRRNGGGQIINVSSIVGKRATPGNSGYCASKFALGGFSESLRPELAADNIRVIMVYPGGTDTEFHDAALQPDHGPQSPLLHPSGPLARLRRRVGYRTPPDKVAATIMRASRRGQRDAYVSTSDRLGLRLAAVAPGVVDRIAARIYPLVR